MTILRIVDNFNNFIPLLTIFYNYDNFWQLWNWQLWQFLQFWIILTMTMIIKETGQCCFVLNVKQEKEGKKVGLKLKQENSLDGEWIVLLFDLTMYWMGEKTTLRLEFFEKIGILLEQPPSGRFVKVLWRKVLKWCKMLFDIFAPETRYCWLCIGKIGQAGIGSTRGRVEGTSKYLWEAGPTHFSSVNDNTLSSAEMVQHLPWVQTP